MKRSGIQPGIGLTFFHVAETLIRVFLMTIASSNHISL